MSNEKRAPTEATLKVDPSIEIHKTLYPYLNYKQGGFAPYAGIAYSIKKTPSREPSPQWTPSPYSKSPPVTVLPLVPETAPDGTSQMYDFLIIQAYPNTIYFDQHWPSHYNPFADTRRTYKYGVKNASDAGDELSIAMTRLPRFCLRTISTYKRCLVANDENTNKCQEEQDNIISICPNWALDSLKNKQLNFLRLEALQNQKYRRAM